MREINGHKVNECNEAISITADERDPNNGNDARAVTAVHRTFPFGTPPSVIAEQAAKDREEHARLEREREEQQAKDAAVGGLSRRAGMSDEVPRRVLREQARDKEE